MKKQKNNRYLIGEIEHYGYVFSGKKMLLSLTAVIVLAVVAGMLFRLTRAAIILIIICALLLMPALIRSGCYAAYEQSRFSDASRYIEKMLIYFKGNHKIVTSLENTLTVFQEGPMHDAIDAAVSYIKFSETDSSVMKEALAKIEQEYGCERIYMMHRFLLSVEENGGSPDMGIEILLNDRGMWTEQTVLFQKKKEEIRKEIHVGFLLSMILCLIFLWMPSYAGIPSMDIHSNLMVQTASAVFLLAELFLYYRTEKKMGTDWLESPSRYTQEEWRQRYESYVHPKGKKERIVSRIGRWMLREDLIHEIEKTFPFWLLQVSLYMQQENVEVAMEKSYTFASGVLKEPLGELLYCLNENPNSIEAYTGFLKEFNLPDVQEAMDSLYSIYHGLGENSADEFRMIIERNHKMMAYAEQLKEEEKRVLFRANALYTTMFTGAVMLVYMVATLFSFFQMA